MTDSDSDSVEQTSRALREAFDGMIAQLQSARDAIDTPELMPPPASERMLAEGYRYLMGYVLSGIERALSDPLYPKFRRAIQPMDRSTIDNADAVYLCADIDGNRSYRIRGKVKDCRHWRGEPALGGLGAPQYIIFELASGYAGESGGLGELRPGSRVNTGTLDSHSLEVDADGNFEILVAPEKPGGYTGNFILSRRESRGREFVGRFLTCREIFHDWEKQDLMDLEILRIGCEKEPRAPINVAGAITMMDKIGDHAKSQMHFWNAMYTVVLETYGKVKGGLTDQADQSGGDKVASDKQFMPVNDMNQPNKLGLATGGGQSTNIYAGGVYLLTGDEALIVAATVPVEPCYLGFHLSNLWGESLDFESYQSSLNIAQMELADDGVYRWVVCHRDPGIRNWLDTTGIEHGYLSMRFTYAEIPEQAMWPTLEVKKVSFNAIRDHLPASTKDYNEARRQADILVRHRHVQRRYRQY